MTDIFEELSALYEESEAEDSEGFAKGLISFLDDLASLHEAITPYDQEIIERHVHYAWLISRAYHDYVDNSESGWKNYNLNKAAWAAIENNYNRIKPNLKEDLLYILERITTVALKDPSRLHGRACGHTYEESVKMAIAVLKKL